VDERIERRAAKAARRRIARRAPGAQAAVTLPVSERLLNELIAETLPRLSAIAELHVTPEPGDRFTVRLRVGSSSRSASA
jgi:hypothetical protein